MAHKCNDAFCSNNFAYYFLVKSNPFSKHVRNKSLYKYIMYILNYSKAQLLNVTRPDENIVYYKHYYSLCHEELIHIESEMSMHVVLFCAQVSDERRNP